MLTEQMTLLRETIAEAHRVAFDMKVTADTDEIVTLLQSALEIIGDDVPADPFADDPPEVSGDDDYDITLDDVPF